MKGKLLLFVLAQEEMGGNARNSGTIGKPFYRRIENPEGYVLMPCIYLFVRLRVIRIRQKVLNRIA